VHLCNRVQINLFFIPWTTACVLFATCQQMQEQCEHWRLLTRVPGPEAAPIYRDKQEI